MTGEATPTGRYVDFWGDGTTHWYLDPPLEGHDYIVICDRGALTKVRQVEGEPEGLDVPTRVPFLIEVFGADANGYLAGDSMDTLSRPVSLRRPQDGIDLTEVLDGLGYVNSDKRLYVKADGTTTYGTPAQIEAWEASKS